MTETQHRTLTPQSSKTRRRVRWKSLALAAVGLGLLAWILFAEGGLDVLVRVASELRLTFPLLLIPLLANAVLIVLSYRSALPDGGRAVPLGVLIHVERSGLILSALLPLGNSGGNIAKVALLRHWYTSEQLVAAGAWGMLSTGLCNVLGAIGPIAAGIIGYGKPWMVALLAIVNVLMAVPAATILLLVRRGLSAWVARVITKVPIAAVRRRRERAIAWAERLDRHTGAALGERRADFVRQIGYKALAQVVRILEIWLVIELLGLPGGLLAAVLYNAMSRTLTQIFSFVPGQLGVLEAGSMIGFSALGLTPEMGLQIALALRFRYVLNLVFSATALGTSAKLLAQYPPRDLGAVPEGGAR